MSSSERPARVPEELGYAENTKRHLAPEDSDLKVEMEIREAALTWLAPSPRPFPLWTLISSHIALGFCSAFNDFIGFMSGAGG